MILVIGDIMIDEYIYGTVDRISPEAPVPVVNVSHREVRPGGAANVAANIKSLGYDVELIGPVGDDDCEDILEHEAINTHIVPLRGPSIRKVRIIGNGSQITRYDIEPEIPSMVNGPETAYEMEDHTIRILVDLEPDIEMVVVSDYAKGMITRHIMSWITNNLYVPVIVDPKQKDFSFYSGATIITPNLKEYQSAYNVDPLQTLLVTKGADGMVLKRFGQEPLNIPGRKVDSRVVDVTGAGDTVVAALAVHMAEGPDIEYAAKRANLAAAVSVTRQGTSLVTKEDLW